MHDSILHDQDFEQQSRTWLEVAREYFPEFSDDDLWFMIYEYTGYPSFWTYETSVESQFRKQLQYAKDHPGWHPLTGWEKEEDS